VGGEPVVVACRPDQQAERGGHRFLFSGRLHEAAVHRADAAIALGVPYELPAALAADGTSEWLERLADQQALSQPPSLPAGASLALRATDQDLTESTGLAPAGSVNQALDACPRHLAALAVAR